MWHGVPFACQRRPIAGVLRMCWLLPGSFDCVCCPHTSVHRPSIACLAVFLCGPGALFLHSLSGPSTTCSFPPHGWSAPEGLPLLLRKQPIWATGDTPHLMPVEQGLPWHPVATGLAGQAIPFIVAASHAHALPSPPFWFSVPAVPVASPALLCPSSLSAVPPHDVVTNRHSERAERKDSRQARVKTSRIKAGAVGLSRLGGGGGAREPLGWTAPLPVQSAAPPPPSPLPPPGTATHPCLPPPLKPGMFLGWSGGSRHRGPFGGSGMGAQNKDRGPLASRFTYEAQCSAQIFSLKCGSCSHCGHCGICGNRGIRGNCGNCGNSGHSGSSGICSNSDHSGIPGICGNSTPCPTRAAFTWLESPPPSELHDRKKPHQRTTVQN